MPNVIDSADVVIVDGAKVESGGGSGGDVSYPVLFENGSISADTDLDPEVSLYQSLSLAGDIVFGIGAWPDATQGGVYFILRISNAGSYTFTVDPISIATPGGGVAIPVSAGAGAVTVLTFMSGPDGRWELTNAVFDVS